MCELTLIIARFDDFAPLFGGLIFVFAVWFGHIVDAGFGRGEKLRQILFKVFLFALRERFSELNEEVARFRLEALDFIVDFLLDL